MEKLITGALAEALRRGRDRYNTKYAYARRSRPTLDAEAFKDHLRHTVEPIAEAVHTAAPGRVDAAVEVLYDLSLELVGKEFFGAQSRYPAIVEGWSHLFMTLPHLLAAEPRLFVGAVTNALYNLSIVPDARPALWIREMAKIGQSCRDVAEFLEAGKVVAWRSGLPHYRDGALVSCRSLEPALARAALGMNGDMPLDEVVERMKRDPWFDPATAGQNKQGEMQLRVVRRAGAFRGFGGLFPLPPVVAASDNEFIVLDTESNWLLTADVFGATFHRLGPDVSGLKSKTTHDFSINRQGMASKGKYITTFPELADCTSFAANATTLAVTVPLSHSVCLIALTDAGTGAA